MEFAKPRRRSRKSRRPIPGTGAAPVPSNEPPRRGPDPHRANTQWGPPIVERQIEAERGRVVALFGPPGVGKSTMLACLGDSSELKTFTVEASSTLEEDVQEAREDGAAVVFIDDAVLCAQDVKRLYDARFVYPGAGALVRVVVDPALIPKRVGGLTAAETLALQRRVLAFNQAMPEIEEAIRVFGMPYYTIHNDDLTTAVLDLAKRGHITR